MINLRAAERVVAALVLAAACGCGGGGSDGPGTQATPVDYPADLPVTGTAPAGATWYAVSGLTAGQAYTAGVEVQQPGPNVELDVYKAFEPTPPNELCIASADTFVKSCQFTAAGPTAYLMLLNKGATPPTAGFMAGAGIFTLSLLGP